MTQQNKKLVSCYLEQNQSLKYKKKLKKIIKFLNFRAWNFYKEIQEKHFSNNSGKFITHVQIKNFKSNLLNKNYEKNYF